MHCFELVHCDKNFSLTKITNLILIKIAANQTNRGMRLNFGGRKVQNILNWQRNV